MDFRRKLAVSITPMMASHVLWFHSQSRLTELRIAASGMAWMGNETKRVVTLAAGDMKWAMWMRVARNYQVRVGIKGDRPRETFDGFTREVGATLSTEIYNVSNGAVRRITTRLQPCSNNISE